MINRIILVGRLTRDPELRKTNTGSSVVTFTVAVDNLSKEKSTSFIPCVVFNEQRVETVSKFARKGLLVGVEGRLVQRSFVRQDGSKGSVLEVICDSVQFLEKREQNVANEEMDIPPFDDMNQVAPDSAESKNLDSIEITDDDLPF
ncbi:MAG: single-stranded DNA-binding protein [Bacilli bacterium]|nr:single-stranded DNA-binding protein [Bacilli bacterium]